MTRPVRNKLFDLEIDEVSVVDRPANQHGLIAFAKAQRASAGSQFAKSTGLGEAPNPQEDFMPDNDGVYDSDGIAVDINELELGDLVYDEAGNEYVFTEEDDDEDDEGQYAEADEEEDEDAYETSKAFGFAPVAARARSLFGQSKQFGRGARQGVRSNRAGTMFNGGPAGAGYRAGQATWGARTGGQRALIAGGGGIGIGATGEHMRKSLGDEVLEGLSKAVNDDERNQYIAKALDEIEVYKAQNEAMASELDMMRDEQIESVFISKAAEYNLPVSPEVLGPILKAMTEVLSDDQLDVVDQLFSSVGDALYDEIGYVGDTDNISVIDQVDAFANELVGKADISREQAQVLAFEANPAAYEAYLLENGR
jgi:hypothetical protein